MSTPLIIVLDDWVQGDVPGTTARSWSAYCASVIASTPPARRGRWVMGLHCYNGLLAEHAPGGSPPWQPSPEDMLFGIPVMVMPGGGLPHLEPR